jgi:hypothetical protein
VTIARSRSVSPDRVSPRNQFLCQRQNRAGRGTFCCDATDGAGGPSGCSLGYIGSSRLLGLGEVRRLCHTPSGFAIFFAVVEGWLHLSHPYWELKLTPPLRLRSRQALLYFLRKGGRQELRSSTIDPGGVGSRFPRLQRTQGWGTLSLQKACGF